MKSKSLLLVLPLFLLTAILHLLAVKHFLPLPHPHAILKIARWGVIAALLWYGFEKKNLTTSIFISMLIGVEFGHDFHRYAVELRLFSQIFLKLIKTIIAPLLLSTLVVGIAGHSNLKQVGRMGIKALVYFEIVTTLALFIGLGAINLTKAGVGIHLPKESAHVEEVKVQKRGFSETVLHIFPENLAKSVAEGEILQIVIFSILFGVGLAMVSPDKRQPVLSVMESLSETMFKYTNLIMYFAPIGVGAAMAYTVGHMGVKILINLFALLMTLYGALAAFGLLVLLPIALLMRIPVIRFIKAVSGPMSIAFATTSSESALPRAMEEMEALGVPRKVVAFVLPTGYSFNLDGTTLYLSLATIFVAQAAGIHLSLAHQLLICFSLMLTSKGVAGIPRASLVILLGTAATFGLPTAPIFIILGIDELMDMARTATNVLGNCLATVVVAKWEGEFNPAA